MKEFLYSVDSAAIGVALLVSMGVVIELGYRIGLRKNRSANEAFRSHVNTMAASLLGILALLLGFTLSLALQRFDSRSDAVVDEANAIGTAYLRAQMLPESVREHSRNLLRDYTDQRVEAGSMAKLNEAAGAALTAKSARTQTELWDQARRSVTVDPNPATSGLFVQALNDVFDQFGKRDASLNRHVPELVLMLLYATFLLAGATIGYSSGVASHRPSFVTYIMAALILAVVFLILDLDRPRRGLIQVSQEPMTSLQVFMKADAAQTPRQ